VLFAESATSPDVVLKVNLPSIKFVSEIEALAQARSDGMVRLIDADQTAALMMLDRIRPGTPLRDVPMPDLEFTMIGAATMRRFWRTPLRDDHLHRLRPWSWSQFTFPERYPAETSSIPMHLVVQAIAVAEHLLDHRVDDLLLHGDIHLRGSEHGWTTIHPKGLIGERGHDTATWMVNPWGIGEQPNLEEIMSASLGLFTRELLIDRKRLTEWASVHSVLSMCWTLEDDGIQEFTVVLRCAYTLAGLMDRGGNV